MTITERKREPNQVLSPETILNSEVSQYCSIRNAEDTCDTEVDAGTSCGPIYQCTYTVSSLTTGTWYFAVTSEDLAGNESEASNIADKVID